MNIIRLQSLLERSNYKQKEYFVEIINALKKHYILLSKDGPWLAGGLLRRLLMNQDLDSDVDIFCKNAEQYDMLVKNIGLKPIKENEHNSTYLLPINKEKSIELQIIKIGPYESPVSLIDSFDFTLCQLAYDGEMLYLGEFTLFDLMRKRIVINKITSHVASLRRLIKYTHQGFYACNGCLTQFLELAAENPEVIQNNALKYID